MASSRAIRRSSRMSSPMDLSIREPLPIRKEAQARREQGPVAGEWTEPPLRTPAPSFEDYKGLERHGVLEHMAPLGTLPSQKVKLRLKAHDAHRRSTHVKNGDLAVTKEEVNTPEPTPPVPSRRSEPRKVEDRVSKLSSSREREEDQDYKPKGAPKVTATKATPQLSPLGTANLRLSGQQNKLREVVDSAVERSRQLGNPIVGLAIKKLWEESLHNRTLAELLDAVLSGKTTPRQKTDFQTYIKIARKQIKLEKRGIAYSPSSIGDMVNSKSPSKSARLSVARQIGTQNDLSDATGTNNKSQNSKPPTSKQHPKQTTMETNGTASKEDRPVKRQKRSRSASSLSSLSSLSSVSLEQDFAPSVETDQATIHASAQPIANSSTPQHAHGPKLHNFSTTSLPKRPLDSACNAPGLSTEDHAAKRQKFQKTFEDFTVNESGIRTAPLPAQQRQLMYSIAPSELLPSDAPPPPPQQQQQRLRNGATRRGNRDDFDDYRSPASSVPRDLVLPPLVDARILSRGGTPNQLGRPSNPVRKGARVKSSPAKRRNVGAAQDGNHNESPADSSNKDKSNNYCESCLVWGDFVCCESCPRTYHPDTCLDPPINPFTSGDFYCNACREAKNPTPPRPLGDFFELDLELNKVNTKEFRLSEETRGYFEGVLTNQELSHEWEYEDDTYRPKTKTRGGYEEVVDNLRLKDNKDNTILCYKCGLSTTGGREIIDCDMCHVNWHLDCMDPPLAKKPRGKGKSNWLCPIHMEPGTTAIYFPKPFGKASVENVTFTGEVVNDAKDLVGPNPWLPSAPISVLPYGRPLGREFKIRRPKAWTVSKRVYGRGHKNDGVIEIENDSSDAEPEFEKNEYGVIERFQERGIKLDFIDRIKQAHVAERTERKFAEHKRTKQQAQAAERYERKVIEHQRTIKRLRQALAAQAATATSVPPPTVARTSAIATAPTIVTTPADATTSSPPSLFDQHTFLEQQTALHLAQLSQTQSDLGLGSNEVTNLVGALISEAPADVISLYEGQPIDTSTTSKGKGKAKAASPEAEAEKADNSLPDGERRLLEALQQLIHRKLNGAA